jgi:hypothetical protein
MKRAHKLGLLPAAGLTAAGLVAWLLASLPAQDFSGANQSEDPCFKIRQMKKAIMESADYKKAVGNRDPSYIQCTPLTVDVTWKLADSVSHAYGKDWIEFELKEEYPAYLMLHYGWFDGLNKKQLQWFEIMGPEPCWPPCPGRARAELNLLGEAVICMDYYQHCRPKAIPLSDASYELRPSEEESQNTFLWIKSYEGSVSGRICSAAMKARKDAKPQGRGIEAASGHFWDEDQYRIEINGSGIHTGDLHRLSLRSDWTAEEIFEGLRTGSLTKTLKIQETEPAAVPGAPAYSLQGTVTVKILFGPVKEERWRVTVKAKELDHRQADFSYKDLNGQTWTSPMRAEFDILLEGEFVVRKVKEDWTYHSGRVTRSDCTAAFSHHLPEDLYKCTAQECPGRDNISSMTGGALQGDLQNKKVKLTWADVASPRAAVCVLCTPKKSYLSKAPYRQEFGSGELVYNLNKEVLPLLDGYSANRQVGDFLTYSIILKKIS